MLRVSKAKTTPINHAKQPGCYQVCELIDVILIYMFIQYESFVLSNIFNILIQFRYCNIAISDNFYLILLFYIYMFKLRELINRSKDNNSDPILQISKLNDLVSGKGIVRKLLESDRKKLSEKYTFPAHLKIAKRHTRAIKFGFIKDDQPVKRNICACCDFQIENYPLSVLGDHTTVLFGVEGFRLNSCTTLFFTFIKYLIFLLITRVLIMDIYNLVTNLSFGNFCHEKCSKQFWSLASIIHKFNRSDLIQVTNILVFAVCLSSIIFFIMYRRLQYKMYDKIDKENQTQDDFSIFVENIPILNFPKHADEEGKFQFNYDKDLQDLFQKQIRQWLSKEIKILPGTLENDYAEFIDKTQYEFDPPDIVKSITLCYNYERFQRISELRHNLIAKHEAGLGNVQQSMHQNFDTIPEQIDFLNQCEVSLGKSFALAEDLVFKSTHFVGSAFVSFKYQHFRDYIYQRYNQDQSLFKMKGETLKISLAPYPSDVNWQNIKVNSDVRKKKIMFSYGILLSVLVLAFLALVGSDRFKTFLLYNLKKGQEKQSEDNLFNVNTLLVTLVTTLITMSINYLLTILSYKLTDSQKHQSKALYTSSVVLKLLIMQFLNTAMIYLVLSKIKNEDKDGLLSDEGLVYHISSFFVFSGIIQIVNNFINYGALWRWIMIKYQYGGKTDEEDINKFQVTVNRQCQFIEFNLAYRYSYYLLQFYAASFYSYSMPIINIALVIIFFLQYWVDKYNLFRRSSLFYELEYSISRYILKMAEGSILVFAIGSFYFSMRLSTHIDTFLLISMILAFVYVMISILLPEKQSRKLFRSYEKCEIFEYDQCVRDGKFKETYWLNNPATKLIDESLVVPYRKIAQNNAAYQLAGTSKDIETAEIDDQPSKNILKYPF